MARARLATVPGWSPEVEGCALPCSGSHHHTAAAEKWKQGGGLIGVLVSFTLDPDFLRAKPLPVEVGDVIRDGRRLLGHAGSLRRHLAMPAADLEPISVWVSAAADPARL